MGHEFRHMCHVETKRLLWLIGVMFAMVLMVQYFERPYGNVISSLFSGGKAQILVISSSPVGDSPQNPKIFGNLPHFDGLNSSNTNVAHEIANITNISEGKDVDFGNNSVSESNGGSDDFLDEDGDPEDHSLIENLDLNHNPTVENVKRNDSIDNTSSIGGISEENNASTSEENRSVDDGPATPSFALSPIGAPPSIIFPTEAAANTLHNDERPWQLQSDLALSASNLSITNVPPVKESSENPVAAVVSISEMNDMLLQSRASSHSMVHKPRWSSAVDQELLNAKSQIENAPIIRKNHGLYTALYRNVSMFRRSYELMEQTLKVYIYREGKRPVFHQTVLKGIYASEGWFMKLLKANKHYVTKNPMKAHLFYLPFSSRMLEETLYIPNSHSFENLILYLKNYLDIIVARHPFWNRTGGADHFLVACHDWAPAETKHLMANCIRALCNSDIKEGFELGKDVSLPETTIRSPQNPLRELGGEPSSHRPILAFFAGKMHGYLRPILLRHWENKDPDIQIFGRLPKSKGNKKYTQFMKSSKYCICAKGYEVNSPRVVEAIFYECVPVIISDNFVPPFFEVLNWKSFAVFVKEKDIPNLKNILLSISEKKYLVMQQRVKQVQQHFLWHAKPEKYDIFHMILHSIWYKRVFQVAPS